MGMGPNLLQKKCPTNQIMCHTIQVSFYKKSFLLYTLIKFQKVFDFSGSIIFMQSHWETL